MVRGGADGDGDGDGPNDRDGDGDFVDVQDCPTCDVGLLKDGSVCPTCDGAGFCPVKEAVLTTAARKRIPKSSFAIPSKAPGSGSYPIHDLAHARNALARSSGKPEEATVKAAVYKKYPQLKSGSTSESQKVDTLIDEVMKLRESAPPENLGTVYSAMRTAKTGSGQVGYRMTLIKEGKGSTGYYSPDSLKELVNSGRAEGMQAYADHPFLDEEEKRPERSVRDLVGTHHDVRLVESDGKVAVESIFVPIKGPGYEWVETLAEAAATHSGPGDLVGVSLYGDSEGAYADLPDGSYGWLPNRVLPTSGDIVTHAGAGGAFERRLIESARARRAALRENNHERKPMKLAEFQAKVRESHRLLAEAKTDEQRAEALRELDALASAEVEEVASAATLADLAESAPNLAAALRESARAEVADENKKLKAQVKESQKRDAETATLLETIAACKELNVPDADREYYVENVRLRGLREAGEIKSFVEGDLAREARKRDQLLASLSGPAGVEGVPGRIPATTSADGGAALLREAGIPMKKEPVAA